MEPPDFEWKSSRTPNAKGRAEIKNSKDGTRICLNVYNGDKFMYERASVRSEELQGLIDALLFVQKQIDR